MYKPLSKYGIIGNCRSTAHVSDTASIDFACLPNFDSGAYFCALLDVSKGGYWSIAPHGTYKSSQRYIPGTNILETKFFNSRGTVTVTDFMPITIDQDVRNNVPKFGLKIVRRVRVESGRHTIGMSLKVTPDWARKIPHVNLDGHHGTISDDRYIMSIDTILDLEHADGMIKSTCELDSGQEFSVALSLNQHGTPIVRYSQDDLAATYTECEQYWRWWIAKCTYEGPYKPAIERSALTLKLLIFEPTGAIVAAPTTSLPEKLGGWFNWDYRFTWLRDASFTIYSLIGLGYMDEASRFIQWLERVCLEEGVSPKIMYGLHGNEDLTEVELTHLEGYMKSSPVRIGNGAADQKQFDIYGEVLNSIYLYVSVGGRLDPSMNNFINRFVEYCIHHWQEPDAGIWEGRDGHKHHTYSKLMCWVGVDRGIKIAHKLKMDIDEGAWQQALVDIKADILKHGYNEKIGSFVDTYDTEVIDASLLMMSIVGFLPPDDPRMLSTLDQVMDRLVVDWFVLRTSNEEDEIKQGEGAFFLSTFWLIDNLILLGRTQEATIWLDRLIHDATPLGLYAEEFDPYSRLHLGNFPQAFTHLGLINTILTLRSTSHEAARPTGISQARRLMRLLTEYPRVIRPMSTIRTILSQVRKK